MIDLTNREVKAVIFAVKSDLETLTNMIESSDATIKDKYDYNVLCSALAKLEDYEAKN